jgi:hypothetical protein
LPNRVILASQCSSPLDLLSLPFFHLSCYTDRVILIAALVITGLLLLLALGALYLRPLPILAPERLRRSRRQ